MSAESRKGKNFTKIQKKKARQEAGNCCQACGVSLDYGREHPHESPQIHHDPPIAKGGDRRSKPWVLDPNCHSVADQLALERDISLTQIKEKLGVNPLEPYKKNMRRGRWEKVVRRVTQRVTKTG